MPGAPVQSHGFQTSVDLARLQTTSTSMAHAGIKRPHQALTATTVTTVTTPTAQQSLAAARASASNNARRDFVRASSATHGPRIAASPIRHTSNMPSVNPPLAPTTATSTTSATPNSPLLSLQHPKYGLPPALVANFHAVGIHSIYPWQASCLLGRGHLSAEKNLLYTAPTGGGKSLVADVLMLKRVIENPHRKAILVLPYVALVQEKLKWLRRIVQDVEKNVQNDDQAKQRGRQPSKEIRVTGFFGGSKSRATWADTDIAVCTIEKVRSYPRLL